MLKPYRRGVRRNIVARYRRYGHALLLLAPLLGLPAMGRAQAGNRAGVIVVKGDGEVLTACVAFTEPTISGMGLLERSGLDFTLQASGGNATVCSIAGEGCGFPGESCFCQCQGGGPCRYWSYWHQNGGIWQYATTGAPLHRVPPGGVDAWTWGEGASGAAPRPPAITFDAICPVPAAAPPTEPVPTLAPPLPEPSPTLAPIPVVPSPTIPPTTAPPAATRPRPSATRPAPTIAPPSATQVAPTTTPTISPSPEPTPTSLPSATSTLASSPTSAPSPSATTTASVVNEPPITPTLAPPTATPTPVADQPSSTASYMLFGGTLALLLTGLALAWRRRR